MLGRGVGWEERRGSAQGDGVLADGGDEGWWQLTAVGSVQQPAPHTRAASMDTTQITPSPFLNALIELLEQSSPQSPSACGTRRPQCRPARPRSCPSPPGRPRAASRPAGHNDRDWGGERRLEEGWKKTSHCPSPNALYPFSPNALHSSSTLPRRTPPQPSQRPRTLSRLHWRAVSMMVWQMATARPESRIDW